MFAQTGRSVFYRLIDRLSEHRIPVDAGDFRLISCGIIDLLAVLDDVQPYLGGPLRTWLRTSRSRVVCTERPG
jgi:hypothetical protein